MSHLLVWAPKHMVSLKQQHHSLMTFSHQNGHGLIKQLSDLDKKETLLLQRTRLWLNFPKCAETAPVGLMSLDSLQVPTQFHSRKSISSSQRWERELLYLQTPHFSTHFWKRRLSLKAASTVLLSTVLKEMFPVVSEGWILLFAERWSALCCIHWNFSSYYYFVYYCHSFDVSLPKAFRGRTQGWTRWVLVSSCFWMSRKDLTGVNWDGRK